MAKNKIEAVAYYRTSSASNVGEDKDSLARQRTACTRYAKANGIEIVAEFYDAAVSGADPVETRPGFADMLARIAGNGVRIVLVEDATRFARDLLVQLTGHARLKDMGVELVAANAPEHFREDTPTAKLIRDILGAVSDFERASIVAKLKGARDRRSKALGRRVEGRKPVPAETIKAARSIARTKRAKVLSYRQIASLLEQQGYTQANGNPYGAESVKRMLTEGQRRQRGAAA